MVGAIELAVIQDPKPINYSKYKLLLFACLSIIDRERADHYNGDAPPYLCRSVWFFVQYGNYQEELFKEKLMNALFPPPV